MATIKKYTCPKCGHAIEVDTGALQAMGGSVVCPECQTVLTIDGDYAYVPLPHSDVAPAGPQVEAQQETPPPFHPEGTGGQPATPSIAEITGQEHDPLYDEAVDYLRTCNAASAPKLAQYFHISIERAQHLIADLEKNHIVGPYNGGGPREILIPHNTDLPSGQRRTYEADQQMQALIDEYRSTHDGREPRVRTYGCSCTTILIILFAIMIIASIFGH